MDSLLHLLEEKYRLVKRKKEITDQLASQPREPFCSALKKDLLKTERLIFEIDEAFVDRYADYKKTLAHTPEGEIDIKLLKDGDRVFLRKVRELVKSIMSTL